MTSALKNIHLFVLDQSVYRQYEQNLIIFPVKDTAKAEDAVQALHKGLSTAFCKLPFLTGSLELADVSTGILKASYHFQNRKDYSEVVLTTNMALASDSKFDYAVMEEAGFPPAMLPSSAFCPFRLHFHPGLEHPYAEVVADAGRGYVLPILCAQATFIPGGLVLSVYTHHSIIDGKGIDRLLEEWSRGVNLLNQQSQQAAFIDGLDRHVVDTSIARLALDALAQDVPEELAADCPEVTTSLTRPYIKWLHTGRYHLKAKILSISAARIRTLQSELQVQTSAHISTFITIATLFWTHITRSRGEAMSIQGHDKTTLGIVVDTRNRVDNPSSRMQWATCQ